jgi:uncharacterized protein (TIGR02466 family)
MLKHELRPLFSSPVWLFNLEETYEGITQMVAMDGKNYCNMITQARKNATEEKPFNHVDYNFLDFPGYGTDKLRQSLKEAIDVIAENRGWKNFTYKYRTRHNSYAPLESDTPHFHSVADMVGVFYTVVPPNSGDILFFETRGAIYHPWTDPYISTDSKGRPGRVFHKYSPEPGVLVLFPSYLFHEVETNLSDEYRMGIVMDIKIEMPGYGH